MRLARTSIKRKPNTASNGRVPVLSPDAPTTTPDTKSPKPTPRPTAPKQSPTKNTPPNKKKPVSPLIKPSTAGVYPRSRHHPKHPAPPEPAASPDPVSPEYRRSLKTHTYYNPDVSPTVDRRAGPSHHDASSEAAGPVDCNTSPVPSSFFQNTHLPTEVSSSKTGPTGLNESTHGAKDLKEAHRSGRTEKSVRIDEEGDESCASKSITASRLISRTQHNVSDMFREWDDVYHTEDSIERVVADLKMQYEDLNYRVNECLGVPPNRITREGPNDELNQRINKLEHDFLDVQVLKSELQLELSKKSVPLLGFTAKLWRSPQMIYCPRIGGPPKINLNGTHLSETPFSPALSLRHTMSLPCSHASLTTHPLRDSHARRSSPPRASLATYPHRDGHARLSPPPRPSPRPVFAPSKPTPSHGVPAVCPALSVPISSRRSYPVVRSSLQASQGIEPAVLQAKFAPKLRAAALTDDRTHRGRGGPSLLMPNAPDGLLMSSARTPRQVEQRLVPHTARAVMQGSPESERYFGRFTRVNAH
eukprot:GEMP01003364.1.p1 GENE.GEMP01003364.1~~GEMP01003364.1.p1  ORF type:complete len:532 (+),score=107.25 GEMP01003364.1:2185-3780(+)